MTWKTINWKSYVTFRRNDLLDLPTRLKELFSSSESEKYMMTINLWFFDPKFQRFNLSGVPFFAF